jgi:hypothetical protein
MVVIPVIPTQRLKQKDHEFETSLGKGSKALSQKQKGWGLAQEVECLSSMCKTVGSVPSTTQTHTLFFFLSFRKDLF